MRLVEHKACSAPDKSIRTPGHNFFHLSLFLFLRLKNDNMRSLIPPCETIVFYHKYR